MISSLSHGLRPIAPLVTRDHKVTFLRRGKGIHLRIALYGPDPATGEHLDWSLAPFRPGNDWSAHAERAERIALACRHYAVDRWFAPNPTDFNGRIADPSGFDTQIELGHGTKLLRGPKADGTVLSPGDGFLLSAGGCLAIVASDGAKVIAAHGGLKSFIRWDETRHGHTGLAGEIRAQFKASAAVFAWLYFAIPPAAYVHSLRNPRFAKDSRAILRRIKELGCGMCIRGESIDLAVLAKELLGRTGISASISGDSYLPEGSYHTRLKKKKLANFRNLIVACVEY